ncbi:TniB family NTP-binding protein [Paenibacillus tritici]|uniref:TniB family NTP-binding protein n=1 Tax=Paenibacillus tritici TaxID=1873425 RepID=UPI001BA962E8|nr:TniB family NTP-binding protein [Paenibacillus tritici]QUL57048.1 TniB family NTP-binding protein [Paenibacillus tritici]
MNSKQASFKEYATRVEHVKKIVIEHPRFNEAMNLLKEVHELSKESVLAEGLFICGRTGVGKTTLLEHYLERFPRQEMDDYTKVPILYVKVSPRAKSPKSVASKILYHLGDVFFDTGTEENMTGRILHFVRECNIEMIILDEFQHLIDRDTQHVLALASDWLKTLAEEIQIPVVLCGLPESQRIFEHNEQLDGRYSNRIFLDPFYFGSPEEQIEFRMFLKYLDAELPFSESSYLSDPQLAAKIYYFSHGVSRYIKDLVKEATKISLRQGKDCITESSLRDACYRITRSSRPYALIPFDNNKFDLEEWLEVEDKKNQAFIKESQEEIKKRRRRKK